MHHNDAMTMAGSDLITESDPLRPFVMRKRSDFLACAQAGRAGTTGFLLQARHRADDDPMVRIGFTCSKKVGNAVARNRAKRRLRAIAQAVLPTGALPGWDYVLIGRAEVTANHLFSLMIADLTAALARLHRAPA
jgi:ribonuclease P protein component